MKNNSLFSVRLRLCLSRRYSPMLGVVSNYAVHTPAHTQNSLITRHPSPACRQAGSSLLPQLLNFLQRLPLVSGTSFHMKKAAMRPSIRISVGESVIKEPGEPLIIIHHWKSQRDDPVCDPLCCHSNDMAPRMLFGNISDKSTQVTGPSSWQRLPCM